MGISLADMKARLTITAGVTGTELLDKFGGKLNTVGKTADTVNKQMASLNGAIRGLAAGLSLGAFASFVGEAARVTIQLDAFEKQLRVSFGGAAPQELEKLRGTMRGLGIDQDQALGAAVRFTSALKLSGQTAVQANTAFENASKLILSNKLSADGAQRVYYAMSQIASKGKVMAEELNGQLGDVLAGFTQQVAMAMKMSTSELFKQMQGGKVSAEQFFEALNKIGSAINPEELDSAAMALGRVKNAWFDFKAGLISSGEIKTVLDKGSAALGFFAQNTQAVVTVITAGLIVALARKVSGMTSSTISTMADTAATRNNLLAKVQVAEAEAFQARELANLTRAQFLYAESIVGTVAAERAMGVAMLETGAAATAAEAELIAARRAALGAGAGMTSLQRAGSSLLALFGGPLGLGIAVVGISAMSLYSALDKSTDAMKANIASAKQLGAELTIESRWAEVAAEANRGVGAGAAASEPHIWDFKNATDGLTKSLWEQAKAARAARVELLQKQYDENKKRYDEGRSYSKEQIQANLEGVGGALGQGDFLTAGSKFYQGSGAVFLDMLSGGRLQREGDENARQARRNMIATQDKIDFLNMTPIGKGDLEGGGQTPTPTGGGGNKTKGPKGATGPTAVQIEKSYQDMMNSITQEDIKARQELVTNTEDRFKFEQASLNSEMLEKLAAAANTKGLSDVQRAEIVIAIASLEASKQKVMEAKKHDALLHKQTELTNDDLQSQIDGKQLQLDITTNAATRRDIQLSIIDLEAQIERNKLNEVIASKQSSDLEVELARRKLAKLDGQTEAKRQSVVRDSSPLRKKIDELHQNVDDIDTAMENVGAKGLQSLEDGLVGILSGTKSVAEAFSQMADQIIADLIRIAVEKLILSAITGTPLFANGGAFDGGTKVFAKGGAFEGGTEFFATGGVVSRPTAFGMANGKMGVMGEAGPEAIMPLRRLPNGRLGVETTGSRAGMQQTNVSVAVNVEGGQSKVEGDQGSAMQLGRVVANVVRQELVNQQRPGGLLSRY